MKPLFVLLTAFSISITVNKILFGQYNLQLSGRIAMCCMLIFTAISHFAFTKGMSLMFPSFVPFKTEIVYLTGIAEMILGLGLLYPPKAEYTGWVIVIFFILILPSNIYASIKHINIEKGTFDGNGLTYLWFRIPLQLLFIVWTYLSAIK
ncbi:Uncharacterized membrane protein [Flexibacter flexilis DSM 6793]|uniref:Uncharacterized membrane protein n=1 Tax=Flexibacter flexilis DSM 6793 TaxID=927664 RepID=A0A1I1L885_9BACT|nr:hypothetical protein [Flexibacter flexilis]SFC69307.1 Uncharacterized membrane protein [Flexibacter flexilis DSM 6793]